eukprot:g5412.t1
MEVDDTTAFDEPNMDVYHAVDIIWIFFCLVLVTLMQPGFACYEVGAISGTTSTSPILLKNVGDASVSLVAWLLLGYGLASGEDRGGVIGTSGAFAETAEQSAAMAFLLCLYQWSFAAACTTIISGAVADRIPFKAYLIYAFLTSGVFYPLLAHWVWADGGWASASSSAPLFGCAFGCIFSMIVELVYHVWSPSFRHGDDIEDPLHRAQWDWDANVIDEEAGAETLQMIKVLNGDEGIVERIRRHRQAPGLVGITAGCATMSYGSAVWVSFVSVLLYHVSYRVFICLKIDDAVGAGAIHFVCGLWGLIAAGFTATEDARLDAGYPSTDECSSVSQLSANAVLAGTILLYVAPSSTPARKPSSPLRYTVGEGDIVHDILTPFSYAYAGSGCAQFSGDAIPTHMNNVVIALGGHLLGPGRQRSEFGADLIHNSSWHRIEALQDARLAFSKFVVPVVMDAVLMAQNTNADDVWQWVRFMLTTTDYGRGERMEALGSLIEAVFCRSLKAHQCRSSAVTLYDLLGPDQLLLDFAVEYAHPMALHATSDMQRVAIPTLEQPDDEDPKAQCVHQAMRFGEVKPGDFPTSDEIAWQDANWFHLFQFLTGPRRVAHPLRSMEAREFRRRSAVRYIAPYAWQNGEEEGPSGSGTDGQLVVEETVHDSESTLAL